MVVWVLRTDGAFNIALYEANVTTGRWTLANTVVTAARDQTGGSPARPAPVVAPSATDPNVEELTLVYNRLFTGSSNLAALRRTRGRTITTWEAERRFQINGGSVAGNYAAAAVWDARANIDAINSGPGIRVVFGRNCSGTHTDGTAKCMLDAFPFANGLEPGIYGDYNDWLSFRYGVCERLVTSGPVGITPDPAFVSASYNDPNRCRVRPPYPEPCPSSSTGYCCVNAQGQPLPATPGTLCEL